MFSDDIQLQVRRIPPELSKPAVLIDAIDPGVFGIKTGVEEHSLSATEKGGRTLNEHCFTGENCLQVGAGLVADPKTQLVRI